MNKEELNKCMKRLNEMKVIIEKIKPLEKKMRYQLDKLLTISSSSSSSSFAFGGDNDNDNDNSNDNDNDENEDGGNMVQMEESDPLAFRPNPDSMLWKEDEDSDEPSNFDGDNEDSDEANDDSDGEEDEDEDDEEILAAKAALKAGRASSSKKKKHNNDPDDGGDDDYINNGVYRAPRITAVPFEEKEKYKMKEERLLKKQRDRMKKSELLSTLKATYGDMPEEDDFGGGASLGKQRESARRLAEREAEKTKFEEETFVRLTTSRKEKKMKNRIMREEISNLHSIADIGNLTAGVSLAFGKEGKNRYDDHEVIRVATSNRQTSRHANGKRRRSNEYEDSSRSNSKGKRRNEPKNSYQRALFGIDAGLGGQKKKNKK